MTIQRTQCVIASGLKTKQKRKGKKIKVLQGKCWHMHEQIRTNINMKIKKLVVTFGFVELKINC